MALVAVGAGGVRAQPQPAPDPPAAAASDAAPSNEFSTRPPAEPPRTAREVEGAPPASDAHGQSVRRDESASAGRVAARALLWLPRWTTELAFAPVRGLLWTYDRYQLGERAKRIFFNDEGTLGLFPLAFFETGFGLNVGARFIYRELFGDGKLSARAGYGGQYRQIYAVSANTGSALGERLELSARAELELFPKSRFSGIGNRDRDDTPPASLIDPLLDDAAIATRFRHDDLRLQANLEGRLVGPLSLRLTTAYTRRSFREDALLEPGELNTIDVYEPDGLVGWRTGLANLYTELELLYDSRRVTSAYVSRATPSTGAKLSVFAGYVYELEAPSNYWRLGVDLQRHIELFGPSRYLVLRTYVEAVTGRLDEVPFLDLPRLGGSLFLRGYERDRFRDRIAALASLEYDYPVGGNLSGFVFVDAGRVFRDHSAVTLEELRVGFGGGIQGQTRDTFLTRAFLSSSIDGGLFVHVSLDPAYDTRTRKESP